MVHTRVFVCTTTAFWVWKSRNDTRPKSPPASQALMLEHDAIARLFVDKGAFLDVADRDWLYEMDLDRKAPFDITEDKLDRWTDRICGFQWAWFEGEEV